MRRPFQHCEGLPGIGLRLKYSELFSFVLEFSLIKNQANRQQSTALKQLYAAKFLYKNCKKAQSQEQLNESVLRSWVLTMFNVITVLSESLFHQLLQVSS